MMNNWEYEQTVGKQSNSSVIVASEEIGGIAEQNYNRPMLEFRALLNNTTAGHGVRNVYSINVIDSEPILSGEVCISVSWG